MSKLNIDQQTVRELFENKKSDFLIPDYQRPYSWEEQECQTLWDDIFSFAFPNNNCDEFNRDTDEYFLGPIVTFKNDDGKLEIIDGQQRLTTLMLMLRAFYVKFSSAQDEASVSTKEMIEKCIWKTNEFGKPNKNALKLISEVSTDDDAEEFLAILKTGVVDNSQKSKYANNYRFFEEKIAEFLQNFPMYFAFLPIRILNNCILLPIEAESQDTALRIFSTLNDRGKPLSDADIFKAQFYRYYSDKGEKDTFIKRWKDLEAICEKIFSPASGSPLDELFTRYMYYVRAKQGNKKTTTEALRKFYEKNKYSLLKNDDTLGNLEDLAKFWLDVDNQDVDVFSDRVLRKLFVLNYAPNGMWTYLTSVFYMKNRDEEGNLDEELFYEFLNTMTAFIWAYAILRPGVNALRTPAYPEMIKIVNGEKVDFADYKFNYETTKKAIENYMFSNGRPITKSMLAWWAFNHEKQELFKIDEKLEIEHIYARKRQELEKGLVDSKNLDSLGNKVLLEKNINIRAADYKFVDKTRYYKGFTTDKGKVKEGTKNVELCELANNLTDFTEENIIDRNLEIIEGFMGYLEVNGLLED